MQALLRIYFKYIYFLKIRKRRAKEEMDPDFGKYDQTS